MSRTALVLTVGAVIAGSIWFLNGETPPSSQKGGTYEDYEADLDPLRGGVRGSARSRVQAPAYQPSLYRNNDDYYYVDGDDRVIDRDEAIDEYWDEIKEYVDGSTEVEAYSYDSGNYYYLDADISNGEIDTVYFPNGGYLHSLGADLDGGGSASGYDQDYRDWEFEVDDSLIDDAVEDWAYDNDYDLEY